MKPGLALRGAQWMFWLAGTLLCAWSAGSYLDARFRQAMEYRRLEEALRERGPRGLPAAPPGTPIPRRVGSLVGRLEIPRLRLSAMVLEGSDSGTLSLAVGRVPGTADPGQAGNVVLGGHRDTFFRPLRSIRAGDAVTLVTPRDAYRYVVEWTSIVDPANREPLKATPARSLTLVTCYPFRYIGPAPRRFIVRARQLEPDASVAAHN